MIHALSVRRLLAMARKETIQLKRDFRPKLALALSRIPTEWRPPRNNDMPRGSIRHRYGV
jgi:hypothetical protein